jgi:hypothetical protein
MKEAKEQQRFSRAVSLDISEVPDGYMVTDQKTGRVHYLNPVAAIIFELCDERHDAREMADLLMREFALDSMPHAQVASCLDTLVGEGLVSPCPA